MEKCLYCGKEYKKEGKRKYCTRECMQKHWYEKNYIPKELSSYICLFCGTEFQAREGTNYCSNSCWAKHKRRLKKKYCAECGEELEWGSKKYCSTKCSNKHNNRMRKLRGRIKFEKNGEVDLDISLDKLIERDKNICHICGTECNKNDYTKNEQGHFIVGKDYPSIDHVIPISKGGTHTWGNVKLAHHYCNTIKSDNGVYEDSKGQLTIAF